jgi:hypothetical protein
MLVHFLGGHLGKEGVRGSIGIVVGARACGTGVRGRVTVVVHYVFWRVRAVGRGPGGAGGKERRDGGESGTGQKMVRGIVRYIFRKVELGRMGQDLGHHLNQRRVPLTD